MERRKSVPHMLFNETVSIVRKSESFSWVSWAGLFRVIPL